MATKEHTVVTAMRRDLNKTLTRIENIRSNEDRSRAAHQAADIMRLEYTKRLAEIRQHAVSAMYHDENYTMRELADILGISLARAHQLVSGITPLMRKRWKAEGRV